MEKGRKGEEEKRRRGEEEKGRRGEKATKRLRDEVTKRRFLTPWLRKNSRIFIVKRYADYC